MGNFKKKVLYRWIWNTFHTPIYFLMGKDMLIFKEVNRSIKKFDSYGIDMNQLNCNPQKKVIYSFGIGTNIQFELGICEELKDNVEIYAFDPTPMALEYIRSLNLPSNITIIPKGLADTDCKAEMYFPIKSDNPSMSIVKHDKMMEKSITVDMVCMKHIMKELNHDYIDIVKMDIEGSEYVAIHNMLDSDCQFGQLCVEFHHRHLGGGMRRGTTYTKKAINKLHNHGYKIVYVASNRLEVTFSKCNT